MEDKWGLLSKINLLTADDLTTYDPKTSGNDVFILEYSVLCTVSIK